MSKLLKQLVQVLDERGIQISSLDMVEYIKRYTSIEINKEISIEETGVIYSLYTKEGKLIPSNYYSLTEALEVLANYLSRVKEGSILYSYGGISKHRVIKHSSKDLYNLLDVHNNRLLYLECKSLGHIQNKVNEGIFNAK